MREVNTLQIKDKIRGMFIAMNYELGEDVIYSLELAKDNESSPLGKEVMNTLLENLSIAEEKQIPICQDTGMAVVFLEIGQEVCLTGVFIEDAVNQGVKEAYEQGYLRKSVVADPLERINTKDNTPAVIHYEIVPGDKVKIIAAAKGFGSENMSKLKMLNPSDGYEGVVSFVVDAVSKAGANPCPPIVIGVGIGGTMEKATILAKKALLRNIGEGNRDEHIRAMEKEILEKVNKLGIGPQGFGGTSTALAVHIEKYPTHIAGLPVAVNINCHVSRHRETTL
ncbi:MAG: fumarate hydratase [Clostridiales bacterium]|nr:fumarate hydratase [Clostridiales bacterium]